MEDDKYYTPEIEEFHVGFEFEYLPAIFESGKEPEWINYQWKNKIATVGLNENCISIGGFSMKSESLRVKKLDSEDIESLGWKRQTQYAESYSVFENKDSVDNKTDWTIRYDKTDSRAVIERVRWAPKGIGWDKRDAFVGTIKNKSELRRLMKQLGINI